MNAFAGQQHQRAQRGLVHSRQQVCRRDNPREARVEPAFHSLHPGAEARIEIPEPLQQRRNVLECQRDHGVNRHADRNFRER